MSGQQKLSSRLSTLNMFGKFNSSNKPPPPIEKDPWYQMPSSKSAVSLAPSHAISMHAQSIASMSVETLQLPQTPLSGHPMTRTMSPVSTRSRTTTFTSTTRQTQTGEMSSFRRGISKLSSSLGKKSKLFLRSNASRTTLSMDTLHSSDDGIPNGLDGDGGISRPWNVKHDLHVDEGLANLPAEWMDRLREEGFKDTDMLSIHSRRNRTTYLKNHPDVSIDVLRSRSNSPFTPSSTSASPNSLSPLPKTALPTRSTSLRRPAADASDSTSITTSGRSGGSSLSPDSTSPPSSYGFQSSRVPSDSSVSSRAPSLYADGDTSDDCSDPGTATASQFGFATSDSSSASRGLPRMDETDGDPPARTPPSRAATLTFVVTNPTPPSPPPAYEPGTTQTQGYPHDEKNDGDTPRPSGDDGRKESTSSEQLRGRRSEETLTPEVITRDEGNDTAQVNSASSDNRSHQPTRDSSASSSPFHSHISRPSRDDSSARSPPESPIVSRTASIPPRLSLHQDDLTSWSAALFSVLGTSDSGVGSPADTQSSLTSTLPTPTSKPTIDTSVASAAASRTTSPKMKKTPSPLVLSPTSKNIPRVTIETDGDDSIEGGSDTVEHGAGTTSITPLFNEILSLVTPATISPALHDSTSPPLTSTYPYLPSPPPNSSPRRPPSQVTAQLSPSQSPNKTLEFLKENYDPHRDSTVSSSTGSRESQMTISASSRWSRATTIRDATIAVAHVRKPSVANAMTVPAPTPNRHIPQQSTSTVRSGESSGDGSGNGSRPLSATSSDGVSAADFPLPPPSPGDFGISSVGRSPMSGKFSVVSDDIRLPYTTTSHPASPNGMSSPVSTRSSQSSEGSGESSSSSSQVNPLSITSASDEGPEQHDGGTVHVELRYNDGSVLSPTDSTMSELDAAKWAADQKKLSPPAHIKITPRIYTSSTDDSEDSEEREACCDRGCDVPDGASAVMEWLEDAPSPQFDLKEKPLRDSGTLYNLIGEPSPRPSPSPNSGLRPSAAGGNRQGPPETQMERPSLQINGVATLGVPDIPSSGRDKLLPCLLPPSRSTDASPKSSNSVSPSSATPSPSPLQRYRGWVSEVVAPLEEFIDHAVDPRELFTDLQEIAEGESGSVFSATVVPLSRSKSKTLMKETPKREGRVAVKQIPLLPGGSPKLDELRKELMLVSRVSYEHILSMDALYVDLVEDALWIEMELMERSLADILALVGDGLALEEAVIACFTGDILSALAHLETLAIVHRDVRSDNLLVNSRGVLKLGDFSNALLIDPARPTYSDPAGVIYWQAPEVRSGSYDARRVDVWSAGATSWEMAESEPPFMNLDVQDPRQLPERWPTLSQSDKFSRSFHDFLTLCSNPSSSRPSAHDLLTTPFIRSSCARSLIVDLLTQCKTIEECALRRTSSDSQGTVLS